MAAAPKYPGLHARIDEFERRFVDKGQSAKEIARRLKLRPAAVRNALLEIGLEVDGAVKEGYAPSGMAVCLTKGVDTGCKGAW